MNDSFCLRQLAAEAGLLIGCHPDFVPGQPWTYSRLFQQEFDTCIFNAFHWNALQPEGPESWDWRRADAAVDWAERSGVRLRGHCLLWYQMLPRWLDANSSASELERKIRSHIRAVVSRYRGRIASWDVVNEAVWAWDGHPSGLRQDLLYGKFGEEYLDIAFDAVKEADPDAQRVLNEALLVHRDQEPQREAFLELLSRLNDRRVPVDACGLQSHLLWDDRQPMGPVAPEAVVELVRVIDAYGQTVTLSELDVFDIHLGADPVLRDWRIAEIIYDFLGPLLEEPTVKELNFWGMSDRCSWYNTYVKRVMPDRLLRADWQSRPLLFDAEYSPKPSYFAVAEALHQVRIAQHGHSIPQAAPAAA